MPALSPQICLEVQKQDAEASVESPRPQLCASGGEWYLEGKVKTKQSSRERELCVISHEEPKAGVSSSYNSMRWTLLLPHFTGEEICSDRPHG